MRTNTEKLTSLSLLTRAAMAGTRAAEIEKETGAYTRTILIEQIRVKPQVRHNFSDIIDFAVRLQVIGHVHTPILVREIAGADAYELIAGERRVRGSMRNEWTHIPAKIFPAHTSDLMIRKYQVSENIDRKGLSLRETSIGLAADVERFGREEAGLIWAAPNGRQRSASWISKHLRFQKYGPVTRELFDADRFDDVEAANKMADIEELSPAAATQVAAEIRAELRVGRRIGRLALDARLNALKGRTATQSGVPENVDLVAAQGEPTGQQANPAGETHPDVIPLTGRRADVPADDNAISPSNVYAIAARPKVGHDSTPRPVNPPQRVRKQTPSRADPKTAVVWRIEEIYETGTGSIERIRSLQADLAAAGVGAEDRDWRLWVAFVDIVASALVGMESETASRILNRFSAELNSRGPLELLNRLHPTRKTGVMPDDFRYDTDREIHPLAPGDWTL
ncbi:ParB family transcriptional regulator, chromosome partitioning protein (plasmid) [Paraburkholderia kururiensis]|uniref:ParB/RepB/Spo0J family partition protein n=1 Tax=Paraburkholderia kururiensis TaxID=984307 RepID=UPI0039A66710